jgi:peptide subunit release factor 1 (eRF1)
MLTDNDLHELLSYSAKSPVLSIYLNTEPSMGNASAYKLRLRSLLKDLNVNRDEMAVLRYFDHEYDCSGRGVSVFSCAAENFFRAYPLAIPVPDLALTSDRPYVKPLVDLLDAYGAYGVVLVDSQGGRVFLFHLGELMEQEGILGEEIKRIKRGGASTFPGRRGGIAGQTRYTEETIGRNMKEVAEFASHFFEENHVRRVLIGGTDDNVSLFKALLPKTWQSLIVGTFSMQMTASHTDVLARTMDVLDKAERNKERRLVESTITAAAKNTGGVIGLEDTLKALHDGRIQTLLISSGYHDSGYKCKRCGVLIAQKLDKCPYCGDTFESINDAVELAIRQVMQSGGDVEVIHNNLELDNAGKVGALLRY